MVDTNQTPARFWGRRPQDRTAPDRVARPTNGECSSVVLKEALHILPGRECDLAPECIAQLHRDLTELERYESLYLERDEECATLRQKLRRLAAGNQLGDLWLPVGGMLIGLTASLFGRGHSISGLVVLLTGIALIGGRLRRKYPRRAD
jgi:hypothetical protein